MKLIHLIVLILFIASCHTEPQPLVAGKDECYYCKMPVVDTKFGAEIITAKGKLYKFDDMGCMFNFLKGGLNADEKVNKILAVNYNNPRKLMDVNTSAFLKSTNFHTPMNSGIAAFESSDEAKSFLKDFPSEVLTWQQLHQDIK